MSMPAARRLARRAGLARTGSVSGDGSGDLFVAFSTVSPERGAGDRNPRVEFLELHRMDPLFEATVQAGEAAIINALAAETTSGGDGRGFDASVDPTEVGHVGVDDTRVFQRWADVPRARR